MSLVDLGLLDYESPTLNIDGDLIVYQTCCVFNDDDDLSRRQIIKYINKKIDNLLRSAGCDTYIMFVTTNTNFRDDLVDDYKANRKDADKPINLAWAKRWCLDNLNTHYHLKLEADDLLGIYMNSNSILWSLDKDLRQIPGMHLDDATQKVVNISEEGTLRLDKKVSKAGKVTNKVYFDGTIGFYYQLLIGDDTDYIVGCGKRIPTVYKSGAKKGEKYLKRKGVGPMEAVKILTTAAINKGNNSLLESALHAVSMQYKSRFGKGWKEAIETQANLLFMVRELDGEVIKRWTCDGRDEYFDLIKGVIIK